MKLIKLKKSRITNWTMTESYMSRMFETYITLRLRIESAKLLIQARPDCWNGNAVKPFAEEEFLKIISILEDKRAAHVLAAKNIAAEHMSQLAMVNKQIEDLEALLKKINNELHENSETSEAKEEEK